MDNTTPVVCDGSLTYGQNLSRAVDLPSDAPWIVCVELKDSAGNTQYGKSEVITRDTVLPIFTSLLKQNEAADGFVNNAEKDATLPLWVLTASGHTAVAYSLALDDTTPVTCNASTTYGQGLIAAAGDLASGDKPYAICVKLSDQAGNTVFGKSDVIVRDTAAPVFTSLIGMNEGSDDYVNNAEKNATNPLWNLSATNHNSVAYTTALDDTTPQTCAGGQTYGSATVPTANALTSDKPWVICVKLEDAAQNVTYGKSIVIIRDIVAPNFVVLNRTSEGLDGYVNLAEKDATNPIWVLGATGYATAAYTVALNETTPQTCDASQTYNQGAIATAASLSADHDWTICAQLTDAAGNVAYGKSQVVARDIVPPTFTSLVGVNEGADGIINTVESTATNPLWSLTASSDNASLRAYTLPLDDTSTVTCDGTKTYDQSSIVRAIDLGSNKPWVICVRLSDAAANLVYGKSTVITRSVTAPTFNALTRTAEGSDGYVNNAEKNQTNELWTLDAAAYVTAMYTVPLDNTTPVSCDSGKTYDQTGIATAATLASDAPWVICVKLVDGSANVTYGKSQVITRDVAVPAFTSLARQNEAADGYVNDAEKNATLPLWLLTASGHSAVAYTAALDEGTPQTCDGSKTYNQSTIAAASDLTNSQTSFVICVRLADAAGNITYGKSDALTRDTVHPVFTSLARTNEASDGYVNDAEKTATNPLWTLSASGHTVSNYTLALDESTPQTCDDQKTYGQGSIARATDLSANLTYVICVELRDAAGNVTYGKSQTVIRDVTAPVFTSLARANEATDSYINDAEKAANNPLWSLSASGQTSTLYTGALDDTSTITCDASKTYDQAGIPRATDLTSDKPWVICVELKDTAGNVTRGKSAIVTRDIVFPTFTSLVKAAEAADGYINNAEKNATAPIWTLSASGYASVDYTAALASSSTCDAAKSYTIPTTPIGASGIASNGSFKICVRLTDAAGNVTYGTSETVIRDISAPTLGNGGIIATQSTYTKSTVLTWTKASDNQSVAAALLYRVYYSTSSSFGTLAEVQAGTAANAYTADIATLSVTGLTPDTTYSFNLLVKDEAGNEAVYAMVREKMTNDLFAQISGGPSFSCGLTSEGKVYCWGSDGYGRLGNGPAGDQDIPGPINSADRFRKVAVGEDHACALRLDNRILCWGRALAGRLGNGDAVNDQASPVLISSTDTFRDVAAGSRHTCAVRTDGLAFCWGDDGGGALGNDAILADSATPVQVATITNVKAIYPMTYATCALLASGDAYCWGINSSGQLGIGSTTEQRTPAAVTGGLKFKQLTGNAVAYHVCGLIGDGKAYCWGSDTDSQLGDDATQANKLSPALVSGGYVFRDISVGVFSTCGITDAGDARCWGRQDAGGLGNGTTAAGFGSSPQLVSGSLKWRTVAVNGLGACGLAGDGRLYCWGERAAAVLGTGNSSDQPSPILANVSNLTGENNFIQMGTGHTHACGLKASGEVYCWGDNTTGRLGIGSGASQSSPVKASMPEAAISLGVGLSTTCAVGVSGNLFCWGPDTQEAMGNGSGVVNHLTPTMTGTSSDRWLATTGSESAHCALRSNGKPYCWGYNDLGQSGTGVGGDIPSPTVVSTSELFTQIESRWKHSCGLTDSGVGRCWGNNAWGGLGDGTTTNSSTPVNVTSISNILTMNTGGGHTCALLASGKTYCWGFDVVGQVGNGAAGGPASPTAIDATNTYVKLAIGYRHSCGIRANGYLYCWGEDAAGELGDDATLAVKDVPTAVALSYPVANAWTGSYLSFASTGDMLWGWGTDGYDQLADGPDTSNATTPRVIGTQLTGLTATAGNTASGSSPSNALDGDYGLSWNAGGYPSQYIEINLGKSARVKRVRLIPQMSPSGSVVHEFYKGVSPAPTTLGATFSGTATDGVAFEQVFNPPLTDTRYLRVKTTTNPSWVGFYEIEVFE